MGQRRWGGRSAPVRPVHAQSTANVASGMSPRLRLHPLSAGLTASKARCHHGPKLSLSQDFGPSFPLGEPRERHTAEAAGPRLCFPSGSALGAPPGHTCHNCSSATQKANAVTRDHGGFTAFPCMFRLLTVSRPDVQNSSSFSVAFGKLHRDALKSLTYRFSEFRQDAVSVVQTQLHFAFISRCLLDMKHQARSLEIM